MGLWSRIKGIFQNSWPVDDDRWYQPLWTQETKAGAEVNEYTALSIPAVWACIRIISETIGSLPLHLYTRMRTGKERATNHPLYFLLHDRPNPEMSSMSFRETLASHILAWGNAYAEIQRNIYGKIVALWPIPPHLVDVYRESENGEIYYVVRPEHEGTSYRLNRDQMLHIPGLSYNGLVGYSPLAKMREALGMALATEEFGARFFGQGTNPGLIVTHPAKLGPEAYKNLKDSMTQAYSGLGKSHRLLLLEEGMKPEKIGIPPEDAQFLETRKFQLAEIARIYNMPLHKLQEYEKGMAFASVEQFSLDFVVHTLRPWLVRFEQGYNWQLMGSDLERRRYFWEHLVDGLLRGDLKTRYEAYAQARNWGWLCVDDIRELENLNPLPDGKGQIYLQPLNMIEAGEEPPEPPAPEPVIEEPTDPPADDETKAYWKSIAFKDLFSDAVEQILSREANGLKRLKANGDWPEVVEGYYDLDLQSYMERKISPVIRAFVYHQTQEPNDSVVDEEVWYFLRDHIQKSKNLLCGAEDRDQVLSGFSGQAAARATDSMIAISRRLEKQS